MAMSEKEKLQWRIWPMKDRKKLAIFVSVVFPFLLVVYLTSGIYWTVFSIIVFAFSLGQFLTPTTYILDHEGVTVKRPFYTLKKPWSAFKRYEVDKNGVFLSPFSKPRRIEAYRGIYLIAHKNRDEVADFVKKIFEAKGKRSEK